MNILFEHVPEFKTKHEHLTYAFNRADIGGYILEFGVFKGGTINHLATLTDQTIYGFDSFTGLPEPWEKGPGQIEDRWDVKGKHPKVPDHVKLIDGWFEDTISQWQKDHKDPIKFLHIDSDLYSSCRTILYKLVHQISPGTIILFDELFGYPYWEQGEWKALQEWIKEYNISYKPLATARGWSGSIKIQT